MLYLNKNSLDAKQMANFKAFLTAIPLELGLKVIKQLHESPWTQKNDILNNVEFVASFKQHKLDRKCAA